MGWGGVRAIRLSPDSSSDRPIVKEHLYLANSRTIIFRVILLINNDRETQFFIKLFEFRKVITVDTAEVSINTFVASSLGLRNDFSHQH